MTTVRRPRGDDFVPLALRLGVVFIVLLGIFFRFYNLDRKVFWEDEILGAIHTLGYTEAEIVAASARMTDVSDLQRFLEPNNSLGFTKTIGSLAAEDPQHPPAYYVVDHWWTHHFGGSVEAMRAPAAIFGVLVLPCVFLLALELFGSLAAALIAVALVAVSPFFVLYSQEAREYSMWTMAIALDGAIFLRAVRSNAVALWVAYGAVTAVSLYVYPLTGLVALGFAAYLFVRERGKVTRTMLACVLASSAALALFAPWLKVMLTSGAMGRGLAVIITSKLSPAQIAVLFARNIRYVFFDIDSTRVGAHSHAIDAVATLAALALCAYAVMALIRRTPFERWGFLVIGLCASMVPLVLCDLFVRGNYVYQTRYFVPLLLGMDLAVAALFGRLLVDHAVRGTARAFYAVSLCGALAAGVLSCAIASQATTWWNKDNERAPAVAARVNQAQNPVVVSDYFTPSILELSLYLDPTIPVRLNLRCVLCVSRAQGSVDLAAHGYQSVFDVGAPAFAGDARYHWVDPHPFPGVPNPLNMFAVVLPAH